METVFIPSAAADRDFIARAIADPGYQVAYAGDPDPVRTRAANATLLAAAAVRQPLPQVDIRGLEVAGVPCERFTPPQARASGLLLYLHGGGFVRGSLALGRANASWLAQASGCEVLAVGYRQAPEHPFPAAIDDVVAVVGEALAEAGAADRLAVVGESSGGGLALALAAALPRRGLPLPAGLAALSPMVDLGLGGASWHYNAGLDVADLATGRRMVALYLAGQDAGDPLASPLRHHFRGCCPLLVAIGSHETMLSDAEALARKAHEAGVAVRLDVYGAMPHGFTRFTTPVATLALQRAAAWCVERLEAGRAA